MPELDEISTTKNDVTSKPCLQYKFERTPHKRTKHEYYKGESVSSDIMGTINIDGMPTGFKRYFISFIEVHSHYAYVSGLDKRLDTPTKINRLLNNMMKQFGQPPRWFFSDNTGEYTSRFMTKLLGNMEIEHLLIIPHNNEENGVVQIFNGKIINAVRAPLATEIMS